MIVLLRVACVVLAVLGAHVERASAEQVSFPDLTDAVDDRKDVTFADLVRLVPPGAIDIRHIAGEEESEPEPEATGLLRFAAVPARSGGRDRMVLLLDFGSAQQGVSGSAVLAVFDVSAEPRLLDAARVAFDRWTSFAEPARLPVGAGDDLLVTQSTHFNSSQSYAITALILLRKDRLELIDRIFTLDDRGCAFTRSQRLGIQQGAGAPFADIRATVTERTAGSTEQCDDATASEPGTRTIAVTYRWDAAAQRYIADSDAFVALARENEQRF